MPPKATKTTSDNATTSNDELKDILEIKFAILDVSRELN